MPRLTLLRQDAPVLQLPLTGGEVTLGRSDACDLVLPGDGVSRVHCALLSRAGDWRVEDRSRHGTRINGAPVGTSGAPLRDGDRVGIGDFTLRFDATVEAARVTTRRAITPASGVVRAAWSGVAVEEPVLVVDEGPDAGRRVPLQRRRLPVGGLGSRVELRDPRLVRDHFELTLIRGRPMLGPLNGAVFLEGERLHEPTPVYAGEGFSAGGTRMHLESEPPPARPAAKGFGGLVGGSTLSQRVFGDLHCFAQCDEPVLLLGESGTGKELAARGLHEEGTRAAGPFVALNCAALPETLVESELFGHERGAFTGADRQRDGAFQQAHRGTLFLDEVGELPLAAQAKLLRTLESGEVRRVGGRDLSFPDVRVVAATHQDLASAVVEGRFRQDLYFRLAVLVVQLPPLRDRPEDIPEIARILARRISPTLEVGEDAMALLRAYPWPGNVRELYNVLRRAYYRNEYKITADGVSFSRGAFPTPTPAASPAPGQSERTLVAAALRRHSGNRSATARELGIPRSTLLYRIKQYGL